MGRLAEPELLGGTGGLAFRAFATLPVRIRLEGALVPGGPVDRMKSAKSWVVSPVTLASRATEPERFFLGIETGGFEPGPICFPLVGTSVGGWELRPADLDKEKVRFKEDDLERSVALTSSLLCDLWVNTGLESLMDLLDLFDCVFVSIGTRLVVVGKDLRPRLACSPGSKYIARSGHSS